MKVLYLILLGLAAGLLLLDAFSGTTDSAHRGARFAVRLLPLALFFWVLVPFIQIAKSF